MVDNSLSRMVLRNNSEAGARHHAASHGRGTCSTRCQRMTFNRTDNRGPSYPPVALNTRVLSVPANQASIRPSGNSVLEENILFPLARAVEGVPNAVPATGR